MSRKERGIATIVALMAMLLMSAVGLALILISSSELTIAANFRNAQEGFYAADAALERAISDLRRVTDWDRALDGTSQSLFVDGPPTGSRVLADGSSIDLSQILNLQNCQKPAGCSPADLTALTALRPWGANNPVWRLYAYGPLSSLLPGGAVNSAYYVLVLVADDPSETDDDPLHDGSTPANPGKGVLSVRAEAFGQRGTHKIIEATIARAATPPGIRIVSWREVR